jgi:hypothetical protein
LGDAELVFVAEVTNDPSLLDKLRCGVEVMQAAIRLL